VDSVLSLDKNPLFAAFSKGGFFLSRNKLLFGIKNSFPKKFT